METCCRPSATYVGSSGGGQLQQRCPDLLETLSAEDPLIPGFDRRDLGLGRRDVSATMRGEEDEFGSTVGRIRPTLEIPLVDQVVDELPHRLLGHVRSSRQVDHPRPGHVDMGEYGGMAEADVGVPAPPEPRVQLHVERASGAEEQTADVLGWGRGLSFDRYVRYPYYCRQATCPTGGQETCLA
jgi:hypothetical protein